MKKYKALKIFFSAFLILFSKDFFSQMSYYQDLFQGGVTVAGYSPNYFQTAPVTGVITISITPGSTIRQAYLICGRLGNAPATTVTFNGTPLTFNAGNQVTPNFNTLYGGASAVHVINVSALVSAGVSIYNLGIPAQASTSNRYQDYCLYVSYNNAALPSVATAIFLNTLNASNFMNFGTLTVLYPFNTAAGDIGYSYFGGYECGNGDGEQPIINGTNLGTAWGQDINSGQCGGPVGSCHYSNGVLTAMSDDNTNQPVAGPEALSRINPLITNGSTTVTVAYQHQNVGGQDNHPWGTIFVWNSCQVPTITAVASPSNICPGQPITLTGGGAATYTWNPGNIAGAVTVVSPTVTTIYTVSATSAAGCTGTKTVNVIVNPLPTLTITASPTAICVGQSATLTTMGANTYTWNPGNLNGTSITVSPLATTIYTVVGTSTAGCTNSNTLSLLVNPLPVVNPISNSPICVGGTLNLGVGANTSYTWTGPGGFNSNLQNPTIANVTATVGGVYSVTVTNASGCKNSGTTNVVISPLPVINPTNTGPYCAGTTINLAVTAATSYTWAGPNAFISNLQNPTVLNSQIINAGVYTVTVTNAGGCMSSGTTNVIVNSLPTPTATSNSAVCVGQPINFTGLGATTYTWSGPGGYISNLQNPIIAVASATNSGLYTLNVTNANGCQNNTTTNVVVNPLPVIVINSPTVCANQNIGLTATGGTAYAWSGPLGFVSNNQNPNIANAVTGMSGVYTVTVTNGNGCVSTAVTNVTVITNPTAVIVSNTPCVNGTLNLTGNGGATYTWTGPLGFVSNLQNPVIANATLANGGTYTLIIAAGTCTASSTAVITINPLPIPVAAVNNPVCVGQQINLTGNGATTYTWTGPGGFVSNLQNPIIPAALATNGGAYILTVTDANGCQNTTNTNLTVNPLPVIAVNNPTVCLNQTINLTANGGATYLWNGPGGFVSNNQNPVLPNATIGMSGVYTVTVTSALGCVNTAASTATVYPLPNPNIISNAPVCVGNALNLTGSGGASYTWAGPNGFFSNTQNPNINNISMLANGTYSLLVSSGSCTAITTAAVIINPLPVINFANTNVTCFGLSNGVSNSAITIGTGPFSYTWNSVPTQNTANATGLNAGNYICTVTDANGCSNNAPTQITQPAVLTLAINSNTNVVCAGSTINLNGLAGGGTGPYVYNWTGGPATGAYNVTEPIAGIYTYTATTTDANGCNVNQTINLTFNPQPTVTATSATVCAGQTAGIMAGGANTYVWQPGNVTGATYTLNPVGLTNISVVGTLNGCSNAANTFVNVNPLPNASISSLPNKGCAPYCMNLAAASATNIVSYSWNVNNVVLNTANANTNYCFNTSGDYTVSLSVTDNIGCTSSSPPINISVYPKPIADFNHAPLKPIINVDPEVTFTDASYGTTIASWNWYFTNTAQYQSTLQNPTFMYTEPGTYGVALVVKSDKGCLDTIVQTLVVGEDFGIYVPNAFTPNSDGTNDIFQPKGFGIVKYELRIFDRWGDELFYTQEFERGWDGTIKGITCKDDIYTWKINATSVFGKHHELAGHVTLMK